MLRELLQLAYIHTHTLYLEIPWHEAWVKDCSGWGGSSVIGRFYIDMFNSGWGNPLILDVSTYICLTVVG